MFPSFFFEWAYTKSPFVRFPIKQKAAPRQREVSRSAPSTKRLPPAKGAPAQRVRNCNTTILHDFQIGSIYDNPSVTPTVCHLPLHRGGLDLEIAFLCKFLPNKKAPLSKGSWLRIAETEGLLYDHFSGSVNQQHVQTIPPSFAALP